MIFSRKIHGIQKALVMTFSILFCSAFYLEYFIACKLGSQAKYENPMKNCLIIQLTKLLHVFLHKSVCSSNSPSICHSSVRRTVLQSVCPSVLMVIDHFEKFSGFRQEKVLCHPHRMRGQIKSASSGGYSRVTTQSVYSQHSLSRQTSSNPVNFVLQVYASSCHM